MVYYVTWKDLRLCCPTPAMSLWNSHQRVYLDIQESGRVQCPYCGSVYILKDESSGDAPGMQPNIEIERLYHEHQSELRSGRDMSGKRGA
jgi:uncharacterized Zn-finger protein